jgi:hypothetical protein
MEILNQVLDNQEIKPKDITIGASIQQTDVKPETGKNEYTDYDF